MCLFCCYVVPKAIVTKWSQITCRYFRFLFLKEPCENHSSPNQTAKKAAPNLTPFHISIQGGYDFSHESPRIWFGTVYFVSEYWCHSRSLCIVRYIYIYYIYWPHTPSIHCNKYVPPTNRAASRPRTFALTYIFTRTFTKKIDHSSSSITFSFVVWPNPDLFVTVSIFLCLSNSMCF